MRQTIIILLFSFKLYSQEFKQVAFYNLENLFDTIDNPETWDDQRTPNGVYHYNSKVYKTKVNHMAKVLADLYNHPDESGAALTGLVELENRAVLVDLINSKHLQSFKLNIIHEDSPDKRGIDVALLYDPNQFTPINYEYHEVRLWDKESYRTYTRDILEVQGYLGDREIYVFVNHWPSRRGGKKRSNHLRLAASQVLKKRMKAIVQRNKEVLLIAMGDFNDDPNDLSLKNLDSLLHNPFKRLYELGNHTLVYNDRTNLFDQILINKASSVEKICIFNPEYLIQNTGRYKGYPFRSYAGHMFQGGYSDHYPVYISINLSP